MLIPLQKRKRLRVLVACEHTGTVRDAFRLLGHDAWSCDLIADDDNSDYHITGDCLDHLDDGWDLLIAHPTCTYLTNAGVRHLHDHVRSKKRNRALLFGSKRWVAMFAAAEFFNKLKDADIPKIALENPIPHKYARVLIGDYSQLIQPWQYGHGETKATCLWLKNLPPLRPTRVVSGRRSRIHKASPGPDRWRVRSRTFPGIARAMAEQWGGKV